ncbi:MAG: glycoside hydrolase family 15 protein [Anaerolineae bacterium]
MTLYKVVDARKLAPIRAAIILLIVSLVSLAGCQAGAPPALPTPTDVALARPAATATAAEAQPPLTVVTPPPPAAATLPAPSPTPATGVADGPPAETMWTAGDKQAIGTAFTYDQKPPATPSKVWFAITHGAVTDILYPTVDQNNVRVLEIIVSDGKTFTHEQMTDMDVRVEAVDTRALAWRVISQDPAGRYRVTQEVVTDPQSNTLLLRTAFEALKGTPQDYRIYLHYVPYLRTSGDDDSGAFDAAAHTARVWDSDVHSLLTTDPPWIQGKVGTLNESDGLTDLRKTYALRGVGQDPPGPGHVAVTAQMPTDAPWTAALAFSATDDEAAGAARGALTRGFAAVREAYIAGWRQWCAALDTLGGRATDLYYTSLMVIKAHEDKTYRGAIIASISTPWGQHVPDDHDVPGYRRVWARDLYHAASALLAAGDRTTAEAALNFLDRTQQLSSGSFPQNSYVDGRPFLTATQMDQVAAPILLAWNLGAVGHYASLIKPAAEYIYSHGPKTEQERWEENKGYSPGTIASEIAALVAAADLARRAGDPEAAGRYLERADKWQASVVGWTYTTTGPLGDGHYFLRITDSEPDTPDNIKIANNGGRHDQRAIVSSGFLDLALLGVLAADDPHIVGSLPETDAALRVETPVGPGWYRYNFDRSGESEAGAYYPGKGHLWPFLTGERGRYAIAAGRLDEARTMLRAMEGFAGASGMLAEQVWEASGGKNERCAAAVAAGWAPAGGACQVAGTGTGSSTPLAWAHAEYVLLLKSIVTQTVVGQPSIVRERYADRTAGRP